MIGLINFTINEKVAEIFDLYTELHGIRISLFNPDGDLIYPDKVGRPNCHHCIMLREVLKLDSSCRDLDRKMMETSLKRRGLVSYTCHAGMREAAAPIFVNDDLIGYVMLGQFRSEAAPKASPYSKAWQVEQGNDALQQEYEQTAVFPEHKIETLLSMFRHLMEFIIEGHLILHKDFDLLEPVIGLIRNHPERMLTLESASRLVGRSPSSVTRLFKKVTGRSFKQYLTDCRMTEATRILKQKPNLPVAEVARALGYEDPLYFSRAFSRHYGHSPTKYRDGSKE